MLPRALGCRSPRSPLKHTHPPLSTLCGHMVCFNHWLVQLLPRFCPQMRPWRTFRTASATLRPVFAPVAVLPYRCGCPARVWSCPPHLRRYCDCGLSDFRKESGTLLGPLTVPERVSASRRATYCEAAVPCTGNRRTWLCAAVHLSVTANIFFHNDLHTNPRSKSERGMYYILLIVKILVATRSVCKCGGLIMYRL